MVSALFVALLLILQLLAASRRTGLFLDRCGEYRNPLIDHRVSVRSTVILLALGLLSVGSSVLAYGPWDVLTFSPGTFLAVWWEAPWFRWSALTWGVLILCGAARLDVRNPSETESVALGTLVPSLAALTLVATPLPALSDPLLGVTGLFLAGPPAALAWRRALDAGAEPCA